MSGRRALVLSTIVITGGIACTADYSLGWNQTGDGGPARDAGARPDAAPVDGALPPCYAGGCSGQVCTDRTDVASTCEWLEEYACYQTAECRRQAGGECGWTPTEELLACLDNGGPFIPPTCYVSGCSGTVCTDDPDGVVTTCEWREEYACYRTATCEMQADGVCGWTDTAELQECLGS